MSAKGKKYISDDDDDDDVFYYRYSSTASAPPPSSAASNKTSCSSKLAPSKSTVYVSNVDYSLTNSDLFTIFSTFGKLAKVTVLKDRATRLSKGVAFVLFVSRDDAIKAAKAMDGKILNGRTLRASIAADNGRASEFIRKKVYKDKSRCYECGEEGHLSYECPKNSLGARERPVQKKARKGEIGEIRGNNRDYNREKSVDNDGDGDGDDGDEVFEIDNWASVVDGGGAEDRLLRGGEEKVVEKKRGKRKGYFSDESDDED